jgi:hypothetical protein
MNYFSQFLNVHNVSDVRQIEVHIVEPFLHGPSRLQVEIAIAKLICIKSTKVVIKFWFKQEVKCCCLQSTNS